MRCVVVLKVVNLFVLLVERIIMGNVYGVRGVVLDMVKMNTE